MMTVLLYGVYDGQQSIQGKQVGVKQTGHRECVLHKTKKLKMNDQREILTAVGGDEILCNLFPVTPFLPTT